MIPAVLLALVLLGSCTPGGARRDATPASDGELGGSTAVPESVDFIPTTSVDRVCRSEVSPDDVAGFVGEWFGVIAELQRSVDANPVRQFADDPEGRGFEERRGGLDCALRLLAGFRDSSDEPIAALARATTALLNDALDAEERSADAFRSVDWNAIDPVESRSRRWAELRPSTRGLSERGAALVERIAALLRQDGRATYGPGRLRISRAGRDVALRHRGRLTDLTIMVELGIDPGGVLSMTARKAIKWLYHAHGLTYAGAGG